MGHCIVKSSHNAPKLYLTKIRFLIIHLSAFHNLSRTPVSNSNIPKDTTSYQASLQTAAIIIIAATTAKAINIATVHNNNWIFCSSLSLYHTPFFNSQPQTSRLTRWALKQTRTIDLKQIRVTSQLTWPCGWPLSACICSRI